MFIVRRNHAHTTTHATRKKACARAKREASNGTRIDVIDMRPAPRARGLDTVVNVRRPPAIVRTYGA